MGGAHSRRKGHQFERDVAIALREIYPNARRQLEYHEDDCAGVDIVNTGPFRIQCKKLKKYAPISCIEEVVHFDFLGEIPVLITAGDNKPPLAVIPLDVFLDLIKHWPGKVVGM